MTYSTVCNICAHVNMAVCMHGRLLNITYNEEQCLEHGHQRDTIQNVILCVLQIVLAAHICDVNLIFQILY